MINSNTLRIVFDGFSPNQSRFEVFHKRFVDFHAEVFDGTFFVLKNDRVLKVGDTAFGLGVAKKDQIVTFVVINCFK